jgi:hypothetical protein
MTKLLFGSPNAHTGSGASAAAESAAPDAAAIDAATTHAFAIASPSVV